MATKRLVFVGFNATEEQRATVDQIALKLRRTRTEVLRDLIEQAGRRHKLVKAEDTTAQRPELNTA